MSGTKVYCPECNAFRYCESISFTHAPAHSSRPRRKYLGGIMAFLRYRQCNECSHKFVTGEVPLENIKRSTEFEAELSQLIKKYSGE